ncbi:hypothetical protein K439DRAFT_616466 [Ramaria rubella]|nr:hypothetical protein K439DRAFT_616466 [Ramaria rubella]
MLTSGPRPLSLVKAFIIASPICVSQGFTTSYFTALNFSRRIHPSRCPDRGFIETSAVHPTITYSSSRASIDTESTNLHTARTTLANGAVPVQETLIKSIKGTPPSERSESAHLDLIGEEFGLASEQGTSVEDLDINGSSLKDAVTNIQTMPLEGSSVDEKLLNLHSPESSTVSQDMPSATTSRRPLGKRDKAMLSKLRKNMLNAAQRGHVYDAINYYSEFTKLTRTDLEIADILIQALCWRTLQAPPRPHITQALQVYKDLIEAERQYTNNAGGFFNGQKAPSIKMQEAYTRIYNALLRGLSAPPPVKGSPRNLDPELQEQYSKTSMELLADMEARGLSPDNRTISSILLLRFRSANNHEEAFAHYRTFLNKLETTATRVLTAACDKPNPQSALPAEPPVLDLAGYRMVLNAFGKLSYPDAPVTPAHLWFAIAKDMGSRGYAVTVRDYTLFLGGIVAQKMKMSPLAIQRAAIGLPASGGEVDQVKAIIASVKYLHKQITLDPQITPDTNLLNTLMNAYQHLGAFDDALRVFNAIWTSGRMDNATPVIIFDACGHGKRSREAVFIWCMLVESGYQFDKQTLDTWVECLCRLGDIDAACKFVCVYMGRENAGYSSKGDTRPDFQTCLILLKLSWTVGRNQEVKDKIRAHLPHIWSRLAAHYT